MGTDRGGDSLNKIKRKILSISAERKKNVASSHNIRNNSQQKLITIEDQ